MAGLRGSPFEGWERRFLLSETLAVSVFRGLKSDQAREFNSLQLLAEGARNLQFKLEGINMLTCFRVTPVLMVVGAMCFYVPVGAASNPDPLAWITRREQVRTDQLRPINFRILSATEIAPGQTQIEFTADLTNAAQATFTTPQANLLQTAGGFTVATNLATNFAFLTFTDVGPFSLANPLRSMVVEVAAPLATATNSFATNVTVFTWKSFGYEAPVFRTNVLLLDAALSNSVGHAQGLTYWITNPPPHFSLVSTGWLVLPTGDLPVGFCCNVPDAFIVTGVMTNGGGDLGFTRGTDTIDWLEWIESATLLMEDPIEMQFSDLPRDTDVSPIPGSGRPILVETVLQGISYIAMNFEGRSPPTLDLANAFSPLAGVAVSATVGSGMFGIHPEVRIRGFKIKAVGLRVEAHPEATFRVRAEADVEFDRTEHDLANFEIPADAIGVPQAPAAPKFVVPLGPFSLDITMFIRPYVGAAGKLEAQTEFNAGAFGDFSATLLVEEGKPSFTHEFEISPLNFTSPLLGTAAQADGTVFAGLEVGGEIIVNGPFSVKLASIRASATVEPEANLRVRPVNDPWWSVSSGVNLYGKLSADLPDIIPGNFAHVTKTFPIVETDLVALSAPAGGGPGPGANAPAKPFSGTDMRWSKVWRTDIHPGVNYANPNTVAMTLNETGNIVVAWTTKLAEMQVSELDRNGNSLWQKSYTSGGIGNFSDFARVPGDGYVLATETSSGVWLTRLDDAGNVRWAHKYNLDAGIESRFQVEGFRDTNGLPGIVVSGIIGTNAFVFRVNDNAGLVWAKSYALEGNAYIMSLHAARGGGFFLVGQTDEDLMLCGQPNWPPCLKASNNGLLLKLDEDGNVIWATACSTTILNDVVETPSGELLAVGGALPSPYDPYHSVSAHKFDSSGAVLWATTYAVDLPRTGGTGGGSTQGDSLVDEARCVALTADGFILGGHTGAGTNTAAWLIRIADNGEPFWQTLWDGPNYDVALQLLDRGDSYAMLGISASFLTQFGSSGVNTPWLSMLPHSGHLDFKPSANVTTDYRYPAVDGFSGESVANTQISAASRSVTPLVQTLSVATQAMTVTVSDYWSPPTELAQTAFAPEGGQPTLSISLTGSNTLVHWPVLGSEGFSPQVANTVTSSWSSVTNPILRTGDDWFFQTRATNVQRYFRLWR